MDLKDRLKERQRESEWATTWRPKQHGPTLIGTLEKMDTGTTEYGEADIAHIRDADGKLWGVWLFHTVLKNEWGEADPTPGDQVGIQYLGERGGDPHSYHAYAVEVEEGELPASEDRPAVEADAEADRRPAPSFDDPNADLPY